MSILKKSEAGLTGLFSRVDEFVNSSFFPFKASGAPMEYEIGADKKGIWLDMWLKPDLTKYMGMQEGKPVAKPGTANWKFCWNRVDIANICDEQVRYNKFKREQKLPTCPAFRFRKIYGDVNIEGVQKLNFFKADMILGNLFLDDIWAELDLGGTMITGKITVGRLSQSHTKYFNFKSRSQSE